MIKTLKKRVGRLEGQGPESRHFTVCVMPPETYEEALEKAMEFYKVTEEDIAEGRAVPFVMRINILGEMPPIDPLPGEYDYS